MTEVFKKITLDLLRKTNVRLVFARENDIGSRNLAITLTAGGVAYVPESGSSAALNFKRSDEVCGAVAASVLRNGDILVQLPQIVLGAPGETVCSVSIFDSKKNKLTSSDFYLDVAEEFYSGENLDTEPDYSLLQSVFAEMAKISDAEQYRVESEAFRMSNEKQRIIAEVKREEQLAKNLGVCGSVTLLASEWDKDCALTLNLPELGGHDMVQFSPDTKADRAVMTNYRIFVEPDTAGNQVRFVADAKPVSNIDLRYFITKGRAV